MSATPHVALLRSADDPKYQKMSRALLALHDAGINDLPEELRTYFGIYEAGEFEEGMTGLDVGDERHPAVKPYRADMREGFDIDVAKLPAGTCIVRVYTSY